MGHSSRQSLYPTLDLKGTVLQNKGMFMLKPLNNGSLWCKVPKSHANIRRQRRRICIRRMSMKRSSSGPVTTGTTTTTTSSKRSINGVERRIRTLKKLVPNGNGGGGGLDGLFGDTADYITCLEMKVKIMQMMINLLSSPSD